MKKHGWQRADAEKCALNVCLKAQIKARARPALNNPGLCGDILATPLNAAPGGIGYMLIMEGLALVHI